MQILSLWDGLGAELRACFVFNLEIWGSSQIGEIFFLLVKILALFWDLKLHNQTDNHYTKEVPNLKVSYFYIYLHIDNWREKDIFQFGSSLV